MTITTVLHYAMLAPSLFYLLTVIHFVPHVVGIFNKTDIMSRSNGTTLVNNDTVQFIQMFNLIRMFANISVDIFHCTKQSITLMLLIFFVSFSFTFFSFFFFFLFTIVIITITTIATVMQCLFFYWITTIPAAFTHVIVQTQSFIKVHMVSLLFTKHSKSF